MSIFVELKINLKNLKYMIMKITVVGTGYVGLVTGTCFAELGNDVICLDIDQAKIDRLKKGEIPIYEPGLEELVLRNQKEGRLNFSTDAKAGIEWAEVIFSAVGTPPDKDHRADLSAVKAVAKTVGQNLNGYKVFVNKSTVPVGTSHMVKEIIKENLKTAMDFDVVDNPEFLREGSAVKDFLNPDRIVCGVESDRAREAMEKLYQPLVRSGRPLLFTDIHSAEVIKYASNSFLATKISFINEVANFCELVGADVTQVAKGMGLDERIGSRFLHAGIGYGGSCFPKDVQAFIQTGKDKGYEFKILEQVEAVNEAQKLRIVEKILKEIPNVQILHGDLISDKEGPEIVVGHDLWLVKHCDVIIVDARTKIGVGTAQEMVLAKYFKKAVISILPKDTHHRRSNVVFHGKTVKDWIHPFIFVCSDFIAESIEEAIEWMRSSKSKNIKDFSIFERKIKTFETKLPIVVKEYLKRGL